MDLCSENNTIQSVVIKALLCPEMPEPRVEALSVAVDGKLYVLGGFPVFWPHNYAVVNEAGSMDSLRSVYSFDPRTAAWSAEPDLPPFRRSGIHWRGGEGMNAVAHAGKVCVFGLRETPPLALARGVWTELPRIPQRWGQVPRYIWEQHYAKKYGPWTPGMATQMIPEDKYDYNPSACRDPFLASLPMPL